MRDTIVRRRVFCARALGLVLAGWLSRPAVAKPPDKAKHPRRPSAKPARIVAIDPGHGGVDPGAISPHGLYEKDVVLTTARELARQLDATGRFRTVLTRHGDIFVPLRERVAHARTEHAELFVSIHADALPDSELRGLSVYTLSDQASDRETAALAARENNDIAPILLDMVRRQTNNRSLALAHAIVRELGHAVPLLEKPHRAAGFAVLTAPDVPSVLVELGCLSNPVDERLLGQRAYQQSLARGLLRAIEDFFAAHSAM